MYAARKAMTLWKERVWLNFPHYLQFNEQNSGNVGCFLMKHPDEPNGGLP